jgi:26S proteasome regulatory subunit N9
MFQLFGPPEAFYKEAINYLSYTPVNNISEGDQYVLATDMAIAALTGKGIYNYGEVLGTPVFPILKNSPNSWIHQLVTSLHTGNIDSFNSIIDLNKNKYFSQHSLAENHELIKQKIVLLSLMNLIYERSSHDRNICFSDISNRARVPLEQVILFHNYFIP